MRWKLQLHDGDLPTALNKDMMQAYNPAYLLMNVQRSRVTVKRLPNPTMVNLALPLPVVMHAEQLLHSHIQLPHMKHV